MSVISFAEGDKFIIRVIKSLVTNPDNRWANSYEFVAVDASVEGDLIALGNRLVAFEVAFHYTTTIFNQLIISTWEPDSVPYDPDAFFSTSLSDVGDVEATSDPLALNQCMWVTRVCSSGRFGHLFYRNCVAEEDVQAPAGKVIFNNRATFQTRIDDAITASNLDDNIGTAAPETLHLAMVNADGTQVRTVLGLFVQGMTTIKTDHKWFNRTSP